MRRYLIKLKLGDAAIVSEADELEARYGAVGAVRHVRAQIENAGRSDRQHLYRLHDEIMRRHPAMIPA
jgi:hypothetical protein